MPAQDLEPPARAVGGAVEVDLGQRQCPCQVGHIVGQHGRGIHREVDLAALERIAAAQQDAVLLLLGDGATARLGGLADARQETVEVGRRPTGTALADDDDVAAAAHGGGVLPPIALDQGGDAGFRGHQRRIAGAARQINHRVGHAPALGPEDDSAQPPLAALGPAAILRPDQHETLEAVAPRWAELDVGRELLSCGTALSMLLMGAMAPLSGQLADRFGSAPTIAGGGVLYVLGMIVTATMHDGAMLILGNVLVGIGLSAAAFGPVLGVILRVAPPAQQALAGGICSAGGP